MDHGRIKEFLASKFHTDYDAAVQEYEQGRLASMGGTQKTNFGAHWTRPGHFDGPAHLDDMDVDGLDAEVVYCEVSAFRYLYLLEEGGIEATRAFNDALHAYASADPERLVVSYQIPIHDIDAAAAEVERVAAAGGKSLQLPVFPAELGLPDYYHERYDPLWSVIEDTGLPICCHTGLNTIYDGLNQRDPTPQRGICIPIMALSAAEALGMWTMTGVLERFPRLEVVFVEPGLGWVAWWLNFVDDLVIRQHYDFPALTELPSFYFHRNVFLTFMDEMDGVQRLRDRIGVENILWASDYPHPPTTWPKSHAAIERQFAGIPDDEVELMTSANAARVWNL
jgi:predicted TIM-barrel fold metal-dependent hydrolase